MAIVRSSKILVLHVPAGGGHKAAARAVAEAAVARGVEAEVVDALDLTPPWFARAYVGAHLQSTERAPSFYGQGYHALDQRHPLVDGVRGTFDRAVGARLLSYVAESRPDAIVATHFFPLEILGHARLAAARRAPRAPIPPVVGVVTDYAAHAFWAEPGVDRFCTPAGRAARDLVRHGVSADAVVATGIPIRPAFGQAPALIAPTGRPLEVLVTSGGFGIGPMASVIRSFSGIADVRLTVVCGDNPQRVAEAQRTAAEAGITAEVVGFERDMARRMATAHVLIGKPGGLTVSEALAAGRPMIVVGACPGQEMRNQDWLLEQGAAVAADATSAGRVAAALRDEGRLPMLAEAARSLASPKAAGRVVDVALRLVDGAMRPASLAA
ncbi:UDP-N-acetylglucosamine--N-acetylmuramyl-(pentapeptide) pyrophosphoryl-undecaprenol NAG transferase [Minicystis rosea]|nr:UDP-N-acetylglucosamine--N-acetylmuramyl-(pentapeptide) pyrophosphoryl-undecaprenol NAG transferase [Minicystis rosea]